MAQLDESIRRLEAALSTLNETITNMNASMGRTSHTISAFNNNLSNLSSNNNPFNNVQPRNGREANRLQREAAEYDRLMQESRDKKKADEEQFQRDNYRAIIEMSNMQSEFQRKRHQAEIDLWNDRKQQIIEQEEYQIEMQTKRHEAELDLWEERGNIIREQEEYQLDLQNRRKDKELEIYEAKKDKIKELDDFELSLLEKRKEIELQQREARLSEEKWTQNGYNSNGKKNSFAELTGAIGKATAYFKSNSFGRIIGDGLSKATNGAAKGLAFVNNGKMDVGAIANKVSGALSAAGPYGAAAGGIVQILKTMFEMYSKVNTAASKFARTVGGGSKAIHDMQNRMVKLADNISHAEGKLASFGQRAYDAAKLMETMLEYSNKLGKNTQYMSQNEIKALQDLKDFGIDMDVVNQFETFGIQADAVSEKMAKLYGTSGKHGLNAKAVTDVVVKNMKMAQQYTFAGGQKALERMAEKAVALKYNMESVAKFAEKVSTLEGAAKTGAELSVLGGDFARMGNPLSLLYGGLQDPERLNEMMLKMTKDMAHWNSEKGQMDISAYNRQRMRAAATSMGIDYNDLYSQALNQGKRNIIDASMSGALDEDTREFVRNIARIKDGKAVVSVATGRKGENGEDLYEDKLVSDLTDRDKKRLQAESEKKDVKENATVGDLIIQTRSTQDKLDDIIQQIKTKIVKGIFGIWNFLANMPIFGNGDSIDMNTLSMSGSEENDYKALQKIRDNGGFTGLSVEEKERLSSSYGIKDATQLRGKSNEELSAIITGDVQQRAFGGEIRGKGTSKSDSIMAFSSGGAVKLSDGEYVVNAKAAQKHMPELKAINADGYADGGPIRTGNNPYNYKPVYSPVDRLKDKTSQIQPITIDPININVSGTINLTGGGNSKSFDIRDIFQNPSIMAQLVRKLEESINYGLDKRNVHMRYPEPILLA